MFAGILLISGYGLLYTLVIRQLDRSGSSV
jgi:hypothetical protein